MSLFTESTFFNGLNIFDDNLNTLRSKDIQTILDTHPELFLSRPVRSSWMRVVGQTSAYYKRNNELINDNYRAIGLVDYLIIPIIFRALAMQFNSWEKDLEQERNSYTKKLQDTKVEGLSSALAYFGNGLCKLFICLCELPLIGFSLGINFLAIVLDCLLVVPYFILTCGYALGRYLMSDTASTNTKGMVEIPEFRDYMEVIFKMGKLMHQETMSPEMRELICSCKDIKDLLERVKKLDQSTLLTEEVAKGLITEFKGKETPRQAEPSSAFNVFIDLLIGLVFGPTTMVNIGSSSANAAQSLGPK